MASASQVFRITTQGGNFDFAFISSSSSYTWFIDSEATTDHMTSNSSL
ncbi:MAG: hypothetical protein K6253_01235 [Candidatus Liberibacter asiaticus]|nr:hypothetical protein [Candidatus Liberibacter asiaticus]